MSLADGTCPSGALPQSPDVTASPLVSPSLLTLETVLVCNCTYRRVMSAELHLCSLNGLVVLPRAASNDEDTSKDRKQTRRVR